MLFSALTVPHLIFRVAYYGDIVPNTFHAKVGGTETLQGSAFSRGLEYLGHQVVDLRWGDVQPHLLVVAILLVSGLVRVLREGRLGVPGDPVLRDSLCLAVFYSSYITLVGGDFKGTGRFVIPILAPLAVLGVQSIQGLVDEQRRWVLRSAIVVGALACALPGVLQMRLFAEHFHGVWERQRAVAELLGAQDWPESDYILAIHGAGIIPYYSGVPSLDMWGLNDAHIAQAESEDFGEGRAGHERSDYAYVLSRKPLIILPEPNVALSYPAWAFPEGPSRDERPIVIPAYPGLFGDAFEAEYVPLVAECESCGDEYHWVHFWIRRDAVRSGAVNRAQLALQCEQPCAWDGLLRQLVYLPGSG